MVCTMFGLCLISLCFDVECVCRCGNDMDYVWWSISLCFQRWMCILWNFIFCEILSTCALVNWNSVKFCILRNSVNFCEMLVNKPNIYWVQRGHFPFVWASGFSSIAAFARRTRSSFFSLSDLYAATRLLSSSSLCSFSIASCLRLCSNLSLTSASHSFRPSRCCLSDSLISVSIHCSKSHSGGTVYKKNKLLQNK